MVIRKNLIGISIAGIVILLSALGYLITDKTHLCPSTGEICEANFGLSSGKHTRCYDTIERKGNWRTAPYCSGGWVNLAEFMKPKKIQLKVNPIGLRILKLDPKNPVEIDGYTVKLLAKELDKDIPTRIYKKVRDNKTRKIIKVVSYDEKVRFSSLDDYQIIDLSNLKGNEVFHYGENSTLIQLDYTNDFADLSLQWIDGAEEVSYDEIISKWNITVVPASQIILDAALCFYLDFPADSAEYGTTPDHDANITYVNDEVWDESDTFDVFEAMTRLNGTFVESANLPRSQDVYNCWNATVQVAQCYANNNENCTIWITQLLERDLLTITVVDDSDTLFIGNFDGFEETTYRSREEGTAALRPYLNLTFKSAVVETAPGTPTIIFPLDNINYSDIPYINYSAEATDGDAVTYFGFINGTINFTRIGLNLTDWNASDGYYNLTVMAGDDDGNSSNSTVRHFRLDSTSPSSNISSNDTSPKINYAVNISLNVSDAMGLSHCVFYNNMSDTNSSAISLSGISDHTNCFNISTINVARGEKILFRGYVNDTLNNWNFSDIVITVANTAPGAPTIHFPSDNINYSDILYINYSAVDVDGDSLTYFVFINGTLNITRIGSNVTDWNASDGYYNITVMAGDDDGNSSNSTVRHFRLDSKLPSFSNFINNASNLTKISGVVNWSVTFSDDGGLYGYIFANNNSGTLINGSLVQMRGNSVFKNTTISITKPKNNFICGQYWFNDSANNHNITPLSCFTVINTVPSNAAIIFPLDNINYTDIPYINYSAADADGDTLTYFLFINNSLNFTSNNNLTDWNATLGFYNATVMAGDDISNSSNSSAVHFRLFSLPSATILSPINLSNISSNSIDLNATSSGFLGPVTYFWFINGTLNSTSTETNSSLNASDGFYNLTLVAGDGSTNFSTEISFTLDTIPPTIFSTILFAGRDWIDASCNASLDSAWFNISINITSASSGRVRTCHHFFSGLNSSTTYNVTFRAFDHANNSAVAFNSTTTTIISDFNWTPLGNIKGQFSLILYEFLEIHTPTIFLYNALNQEKIKLFNNDGTATFESHLNVTKNFTGNQIYGETNIHPDGNITVIINTPGIHENITGFNESKLNGFKLIGNHSLEVEVSGRYQTDFWISLSGGVKKVYESCITVNGIHTTPHAHRKQGSAGDIGSMSGGGIIDLTEGDLINLQIRNNDGTQNVDIFYAGMRFERIGDLKP